ncbi:hypothetical protein TRFO_13237 [Tritrichomonas foetus]|uniref:Uncharacterized protein n=1 Tax=Tritrichomonas foetus TaxID=1144522 RepID=A0A1J4KYQ9_9EUKA|nr:hypothetical protein TRFO_13237 [Tritrichomonas foetus]|eukprot:OHT16383.1 hypothetical protein TRFO_13237 [Tritrichomonas foetus]
MKKPNIGFLLNPTEDSANEYNLTDSEKDEKFDSSSSVSLKMSSSAAMNSSCANLFGKESSSVHFTSDSESSSALPRNYKLSFSFKLPTE